MFWVVSRNFVATRHPFRKQVSGVHKSTSFCYLNYFFVFRNAHAQSTTLGPKLMFVVVSLNFVAARHPFLKRVSRVHSKHEFLPPEPFLRFSQRTCPIHYFRSKTHVWGGFTQFRCRTSPIPKTGVGVHSKHEFLPPVPFLRFSQRTCPLHYFRSKTHVWGGFTQFRCRTSPIPKTGVGVHSKHEFCHRNHFFVFRNEHAHSTTLGPKLMIWVVSRNFVSARQPFCKRVSGVHKTTSFCHRNHFFVFHNKHAQSTTLGPKLMFGVVSRNFGATRHPFRKRASGCIEARVFTTATISSFFTTNMPNPLL
jgi:hypothetical protein